MPWNPEKYNQFKNIRYQPFFDLMKLVVGEDLKNGVDIGCGTGEQTSILAENFTHTTFLGIDSSSEMLSVSKELEHDRLKFLLCSVESFITADSKWDLLFSNAALQWLDNHDKIFPQLLAKLNQGGQFAVQMPSQTENILNKILLEMAQERPFSDMLKNWKRESPVLSIDAYAQILFESGLENIQIVQKVYPIIADDSDQLFDFISGSSLIPYMERLSESERKIFTAEYKNRIQANFKSFPAIYGFKRLLLYGRKV